MNKNFELRQNQKEELFTEYLLECLKEESSEIIKEACKIYRFGIDSNFNGAYESTNRENLVKELRDLHTVVNLLAENNVISLEEIFENKFEIEAKKNKILHFFNLKHPDLGKMKP
jgi:NTP pyrophosphatase (non-canonical NTP hydrolase)